ncbi:MAG TPA: hypothetical protein VF221_18540 [Chloroflexota bacterium]
MKRLATAFRAIAATAGFLVTTIRYIQRRRNGGKIRPDLQLEFIHPPYWGGVALELAVRNTGDVPARDCRYCRFQRFTMDGPGGETPSLSVGRWYATNSFSVPGQQKTRSTALLTRDPCPREILNDVVPPSGGDGFFADAIICRDTIGTFYRFQPSLGPGAQPDVWSKGALDRFRGRACPRWAEWVTSPAHIERIEWM